MNNNDNSGWYNNDNYSDNSQWNSNSPWDNGQSQSWGSGNFNQNWSNDSFGSGYQQNYSSGAQRGGGGYSGNNRMVPYGNNQSKFAELKIDQERTVICRFPFALFKQKAEAVATKLTID